MDTEDPLRLWQHIHGATTHFPIALVFVAAAFDTGALLFKKPSWRTVGYWTLIAAFVMLLPAMASGLYGIYLDATGKATYAAEGYNHVRTIKWHRNMSFFATGFLAIPAIWRTMKREGSAVPLLDDRDTRPETVRHIVCLLLTLIGAAFIAVVGYNGAYIPRGY